MSGTLYIDGHSFKVEDEDEGHPGFTRLQYKPPPYTDTYHLSVPTILLEVSPRFSHLFPREAVPAVDGNRKNLWDHLLT